MKRLSSLFFVAGLLLLPLFFALSARAENTGIGNEYPSILRGVRPLGMGNTFLTMKGTDFNAQFYNPAAINDFEKKRHYLFLNPSVDFNTQLISTMKDVFDLASDISDADSDSGRIDVFNAFTQKHTGEFNRVALGMPLFHIRHKYYAAGLVLDSKTAVSLRNRAFPNFEIKSTSDAGLVGGSAWGFFDESLQVGGNVKVLYRVAIEEQITSGEIINQDIGDIIGWSQWGKGFGVGVDLGTKYVLPWWREKLRPTVALTIQDVGHTRFSGGAPKQPMSISAGGGVFPKVGPVELGVLADFRELEHQQDILKKIHAGVEAKFPEKFHTKLAVRAGTNQGYIATGLSAEWPIVALHFAFYGEEVGEFTRSKASYRLASQLTFGF